MRKARLLFTIALVAFPAQAKSPPAELSGTPLDVPSIGEATYRWLGIPLYDAALFTPRGAAFDWQRPFALELSYRRRIPGSTIAWATMVEMDRIEGAQADHAEIEQQVAACFPDVTPGDRLVAVAESDAVVSIWFNGQKKCELDHPDLTDRFFGIWLSTNSRDPDLTRQLLGPS